MANVNPDGITGIVRYNSSSTDDPTSTSTVVKSTSCNDETYESLVPHLALNVGNIVEQNEVNVSTITEEYVKWAINGSSLLLDWADPTIKQVMAGNSSFPTAYNVVPLNVSQCFLRSSRQIESLLPNKAYKKTQGTNNVTTDKWSVLVIEDVSGAKYVDLHVSIPHHL